MTAAEGSTSKTSTATEPPPSEIAATKEYGSLDEIDVDIAKYEAEYRATQSQPLWLNAVFGMLAAVIVFFFLLIYVSEFPTLTVTTRAGVGALAGTAVFIAFFVLRQTRLSSLATALDILRVRRRTTTGTIPSTSPSTGASRPQDPSPPSYFDRLVDINLANLGDYYALVRLHNDKSFMVSVWVGCLGFALILAAVAISFFRQNQTLPTVITAGSGVITEFIAAVFFYLYNRAVRQMRDYFQSLLTVQNLLLSLRLVSDTKDESEKTKMVMLLLSYLVKQGPQIPEVSLAQESSQVQK